MITSIGNKAIDDIIKESKGKLDVETVDKLADVMEEIFIKNKIKEDCDPLIQLNIKIMIYEIASNVYRLKKENCILKNII